MRINQGRPIVDSDLNPAVQASSEDHVQQIRPTEGAPQAQKDLIDLEGTKDTADRGRSGHSKVVIVHTPFDWNVESLEGTPADLAPMDPRHADLMNKLANQIQAKMVSATPV